MMDFKHNLLIGKMQDGNIAEFNHFLSGLEAWSVSTTAQRDRLIEAAGIHTRTLAEFETRAAGIQGEPGLSILRVGRIRQPLVINPRPGVIAIDGSAGTLAEGKA